MARGLGDQSAALLDAFVAAWARGETPDPRETLDSAPSEEREALAVAIDRAVTASPAREPSARSRAFVAELRELAESHERAETSQPPLLAARVARGVKRASVVKALVEALGLGGGEERVALRYHELETGQLDASRVSARVWAVLASLLGDAAVVRAHPWQPPPGLASPAPVFYRDSQDASEFAVRPVDPQARPELDDEVDQLFGVTDALS